ncbi:ead/Ea22-like family protein [Citrobacter freundii complex sp. 2024EL-00238]|uniref:ead/Ea22-like family protein n=1 Tax=Citrobacter TaxID=544 RepID=UPI0004D88942|nr:MULTISPECIES: ead/Ea22-like family protein [Citrobacter]KEL77322.1 ead/Ea22-like family protein [Citrobacter freundii]MDM3187674.1 ead/Ea22-like family protein [Citrobacter sp. Cf101]HBV0977233.1 ead/Ea22-like family protein [Citrobacter freundii]HEI9736641.1 ead/Ea22-like family protein [Citrobacter freundii]
MSNIDKRVLRKAAMHAKTEDDWGCDADNFHDKATPDAVLALLDELEAAEKRIAELEARTVTLPQPAQWDISEVLLDKVKVVSAIRAAGIGVKGE